MQRFLKSVRSALRRLYRSPEFGISAVVTLALGIGVNSAVFSVVHAVLLHRLPYRDSAQIVSIKNPQALGLKGTRDQFLEVSKSLQSVQGVAAYHSAGVNFGYGKDSRRVVAAEVNASFLNVMGIVPVLGRDFAPGEDAANQDKVVLVSQRVWRDDFGGDRSALGAAVSLNGEPYTVVGVLPKEMDFPDRADLWVPTAFDPNSRVRGGGAFYLQFVARLNNGVTITQAQAESLARATQLLAPGTKLDANRRPELAGLESQLTATIRPALLMLFGTVAFVLAIACANVAGLMIVRLLKRRQELGIRVALGASRFELLREQGMEALVLSFVGGTLGVLLAYAMLNVFYIYFWPASLFAQFSKPSMNLTVLGYTVLVAVVAGLCSVLAPAWLISRQAPILSINKGAWGDSKQARFLRKSLVTGEIALAVLLLSGAGLLIRTIQNLVNVPLGYDTHNLLTFSIALRGEAYAPPGQNPLQSQAVKNFYATATGKLRALPDVVSAGAVSNLPLGQGATMVLPLAADNDPSKPTMAELRIASPGYFEALSIPFLQGGTFPEGQVSAGEKAVILTRDLSEELWPGQNPIGRQVFCSALGKDAFAVVGIIGSGRQHDLRESDPLPLFYLSSNELAWPSMTFVLRTNHDPRFISEMARQAVHSIDKSQPLFDVRTMDHVIREHEALESFERMGLLVFSILAVLLAAVGIYGTISYSVAQRTGEIGIRMALGASRIRTLSMVLSEAGWLSLVGSLCGIAASFYLAKFLSSILFGISPHDPVTLIAVTAVFMTVALSASYPPAHKAAFTDPLKALRSDN
jgi:predicted permease